MGLLNLLVLNIGLLDGLLGVAGMIMKLVMTGIIPEHSLLSTSRQMRDSPWIFCFFGQKHDENLGILAFLRFAGWFFPMKLGGDSRCERHAECKEEGVGFIWWILDVLFPLVGWLKTRGLNVYPLSQQVNDIIMIDGIPNGPLYFFPNGHYWSYSDYYSIRYRLSL